jgi:ABC-type antimicrobial peptide transport system permease subunit
VWRDTRKGFPETVVCLDILRNAATLTATGLIIGGIGAWFLCSAARNFLFRLDAKGPREFAAAIATLAVVAVVASLIPARRAASVDPIIALRSE